MYLQEYIIKLLGHFFAFMSLIDSSHWVSLTLVWLFNPMMKMYKTLHKGQLYQQIKKKIILIK